MRVYIVGTEEINAINSVEGIFFEGKIKGDDSVQFHFSCCAQMIGNHYDYSHLFADHDTLLNICKYDLDLANNFHSKFTQVVHMMLSDARCKPLPATIEYEITLDDEITTVEQIEIEAGRSS